MFLKTHNWGRVAKFFQELGFEPEFSTDHSSDHLRNGDGARATTAAPMARIPSWSAR